MQIECPWCGMRPENEFQCGGQTAIARPGPPEQVNDEAWGRYMFFRDNPRGVLAERWRHSFGCGQWFNLLRDTATHRVHAAYGITAPRPQLQGEGDGA
jgi:sarcosine oxidase subunit delta